MNINDFTDEQLREELARRQEADKYQPVTIEMYLHGDKANDWQTATDLDMPDHAAEKFVGILYEVKFLVEVVPATGAARVVEINVGDGGPNFTRPEPATTESFADYEKMGS